MPSKLQQLQLQFRQKLMQEKEERMIKIHTDSQQKALSKVTRYDSHPPAPPSSTVSTTVRKPPPVVTSHQPQHSPVKKSSPGVDRSRPLPPINREQKASQSSRSNSLASSTTDSSCSSSSSTTSMRVAIQNGARSRSAEVENGVGAAKTNGRIRQKSEVNHGGELQKATNSYQLTNGGRKSPNADAGKQRQMDTNRLRAKVNSETTLKVSNGHMTVHKSSSEQRTMAGNAKPAQTANSTAARGKTKPTVGGAVRKPAARAQGSTSAMPPRKPPNPNQEQCRYCGRNFNKDRIEKHSSICAKASQKKVKVFDVTKMRVKGTEAEQYVKKGMKADPPKPKKSNWKKQHEEFINAIRQAKIAQRHLAAGGKLSDLPPPPPSDTSSYVPCPYCGRKFDEGVAQRHIPKCKNIVSNKKTPPKRK